MNKKIIAQKIQQILTELYPNPPIPLHHKDAYTLLIAVILSGHSTDAMANKVTPILFGLADTPEKMVKLSVGEIQAIIRPCGLSARKSQAIWELSAILIDRFHCHVPDTFEELESLPGVGHKTASVVMAQAFNQPAFPIDTHIHRCAKRWCLSSGKSIKQTEKDLKELFPESAWTTLHLQIIYFARQYCQARRHDPSICPICSWIPQERSLQDLPSKSKK
jgi:endonuclease-3